MLLTSTIGQTSLAMTDWTVKRSLSMAVIGRDSASSKLFLWEKKNEVVKSVNLQIPLARDRQFELLVHSSEGPDCSFVMFTTTYSTARESSSGERWTYFKFLSYTSVLLNTCSWLANNIPMVCIFFQ